MATTSIINPARFFDGTLTSEDQNLIPSQTVEAKFDTREDRIELYVYDYSENLVQVNYDFKDWSIEQDSINQGSLDLSNIIINPEQDGRLLDSQNATAYVLYTFVKNRLASTEDSPFFIKSVSSDRTELTLQTNTVSDDNLKVSLTLLEEELKTNSFYNTLYLNFGTGPSTIVTNIRLDITTAPNTIQVKLYKPLDISIQTKTECWIQSLIANPVGYEVLYDDEIEVEDTSIKIKGPNFNLNRYNQTNTSNTFQTKNQLDQTSLTGSKSQLNSLLEEKGVELNIDYTDYSNFVHFSSATQRLENFYYKASLIESYQNDIDAITGSTAPTLQQSQSIASLQGEINRIITNFDGYDYYLYYESGSKAWPKTNSTKPYSLASTGSAAVISWYGTPGVDGTGQLQSASLYDNENQDNLVYSIPEFIREDSANTGYELFIEMIGQHFDNLYLYTEAITQKYNADNRLEYGVSKDLVADTLRSFGVKLYENNFSTDDLYTALIGLTPEGSTLPLPSISTTFPVTGSGLEYIETIISASNEVVPLDDLNKSIYKRLYHNLPALVKKKGTLAGIKLLVNTYGISDTILRINEFGGKDKNSNTWDYWQNEYDYAFDTQGTNFITSSFSVNTAWGASDDVPGAVVFRFKTPGIPLESNYSQSLWSTDGNNTLRLRYVGTADTSGSYSGSIVNPYNKYGRLEFFPDSTDLNSSASLYLPFFDGGWWSVLVNKNSDSSFTVYSGNSIYNGNDGNTLGFTDSDSVTKIGNWSGSIESYFGSSSLDATLFSGSLQEIRYYKNPISQSVFNDFIMNPDSIEGNGLNSSPDQLIFRAALGSELYTGSVSIHPKVSGEWTTTASFASDSNFYFHSTPVYQANTGLGFYDQPAVGIKNAVSNKIRLEGSTLYGTTLSSLTSLQQNYPASESYTRNVNYLEVGYSPQNEINEDIMDSIGYFNIGEYIGDPRQISSTELVYPDLEELKKDYFKKYNKSYDYQDYFRIIKFYDNSLFKMIKDFIPARTAAATGAIVKQHLLERNRQRPAQVSYSEPYYTASVSSAARDYESGSIEVFEGGPAGAVNNWVNVSQSYTASVLGPEGLVTYIESSEREFYNGAYSGSTVDVVNGKLQDNPLLGEAYRVSIPDYQNLNVIGSGSLAVTTAYTSSFSTSSQDPDGFNPWPESTPVLEWYSTNTVIVGEAVGRQYLPLTTQSIDKGTYNPTTYTYTAPYTVPCDITIFITSSYTFNNAGLNPVSEGLQYPEVRVYLYKNSTRVDNGVVASERFRLKPGGEVLKVPGDLDQELNTALTFKLESFELEAGATYKVGIMTVGTTNKGADNARQNPQFTANVNLDISNWDIKVTNLAAQSTYYLDPTVYTQQNFPGDINEFPDYNSLLNNVYSNRVSSKYFDVDYNSNALNPTNFGPIVSQSALYAQIQDSNYDPSSSFFETRYGGTKYTGTLNTTESIKQNSTPPNIPVDRFINYFAISDRIQYNIPSTTSNIHLISLVSPSGDVIALNSDDTTVRGLLQQVFPSRTTGSLLDVGLNTTTTGSLQNLPVSESGVFRVGAITDIDGANIVSSQPNLNRNSLTLIIPQNYNPNLNPVSIAKGAGII